MVMGVLHTGTDQRCITFTSVNCLPIANNMEGFLGRTLRVQGKQFELKKRTLFIHFDPKPESRVISLRL